MKNAELGLYQHYKGGLYRLLFIAHHSETFEEMAVYINLSGGTVGSIWVRPLAMFLEDVTKDGKTQPRFKFLGPVPTPLPH